MPNALPDATSSALVGTAIDTNPADHGGMHPALTVGGALVSAGLLGAGFYMSTQDGQCANVSPDGSACDSINDQGNTPALLMGAGAVVGLGTVLGYVFSRGSTSPDAGRAARSDAGSKVGVATKIVPLGRRIWVSGTF